MNVFYAKTSLYAYPLLEKVMEQIDDLMEKKALSSMSDYSPCLSQCEKMVDYIFQKDLLIDLKIILNNVLDKFTREEIKYFEYKYFKREGKKYFENFDTQSRAYFRNQVRLAEKFAKRLERFIDDKKFEEEYLNIEFFKELYKRVVEHEKKSYKNHKKINYQLEQSEKTA